MTSGEADGDATTTFVKLLPRAILQPEHHVCGDPHSWKSIASPPLDLGHDMRSYQHTGHLGTWQELQQGWEQVQGEQSGAEEGLVRWGRNASIRSRFLREVSVDETPRVCQQWRQVLAASLALVTTPRDTHP